MHSFLSACSSTSSRRSSLNKSSLYNSNETYPGNQNFPGDHWSLTKCREELLDSSPDRKFHEDDSQAHYGLPSRSLQASPHHAAYNPTLRMYSHDYRSGQEHTVPVSSRLPDVQEGHRSIAGASPIYPHSTRSDVHRGFSQSPANVFGRVADVQPTYPPMYSQNQDLPHGRAYRNHAMSRHAGYPRQVMSQEFYHRPMTGRVRRHGSTPVLPEIREESCLQHERRQASENRVQALMSRAGDHLIRRPVRRRPNSAMAQHKISTEQPLRLSSGRVTEPYVDCTGRSDLSSSDRECSWESKGFSHRPNREISNRATQGKHDARNADTLSTCSIETTSSDWERLRVEQAHEKIRTLYAETEAKPASTVSRKRDFGHVSLLLRSAFFALTSAFIFASIGTVSYVRHREQEVLFDHEKTQTVMRGSRLVQGNFSPTDFPGVNSNPLILPTVAGAVLKGWYLKHEDGGDRPVIIYFHKQGSNVGNTLAETVSLYTGGDVDVVSVDVRGFGASRSITAPPYAATPITSQSMKEDALAIVQHIIEDRIYSRARKVLAAGRDPATAKDTQGQKVFLWGDNLGASLAVTVAASPRLRDKISGLVLVNAWASSRDYVCSKIKGVWFFERMLKPWLKHDIKPPFESLDCPVMFISRHDDISTAQDAFQQCTSPNKQFGFVQGRKWNWQYLKDFFALPERRPHWLVWKLTPNEG